VEAYHDDAGIVWPYTIAPYQVLVMPLNVRKDDLMKAATDLYEALQGDGFEVLLDDRDERGGVKFNDADLIGIPLQIIVGDRGLAKGVVEVKTRQDGNREEVPLSSIVSYCHTKASELQSLAR
jgi:prolyl-tRNA synthetase